MVIYVVFVASILIGALSWTFLEYLLHRFWGHEANSKKWYNIFTKLHNKHHAIKGFYASFREKTMLLISVAAISYPTMLALTNPIIAYGFALGMMLMAAFYEYLHFSIHDRAPKNRFELWARKHHLSHHFTHPQYNHGVTTDFWDRVFGTYRKVDCVKVPKPLCNDWLIDEQLQSIKKKWSKHFRLRGFQA